MKPVVFHPEAEAEVRAAITYFEEQREGLGIEFREAVELATGQICQTPQRFFLYRNDGLRRYILRRFPYSIFYLELETTIWIAAVAHHRRRPGYWARRTLAE